MKDKKKKKEGGAKMVLPGWFASYADMVTVLMVFFILLFAFSQIDEAQFQELLAGVRGERIGDGGDVGIFGPPSIFDYNDPIIFLPEPPPEPAITGYIPEVPPPPTEADIAADMADAFRTYLAPYYPQPGLEGQPDDVGIDVGIFEAEDFSYIRLVMYDRTHFQSAQSVLLPAAIDVLNLVGPQIHYFAMEGHRIVIEGHADNRPLSSGHRYIDNLGLSMARAGSVFRFLANYHNVPPEMMQAAGMGDFSPIDTNETEEGRANNRRVEIRIYTEVHTTVGTRPGPTTPAFTIPGL